MPISITIDGENAAEVQSEMRAFLGGEANAVAVNAPIHTTGNLQQAEDARPVAEKAPRGRKPKATVTDVKDENEGSQAIQPGEERAEPEAETQTVATKPLTLDDVRAAAKPYIDKFGMPAASSDLTPCLVAATGCKAISELADKDQATLQKAVDAFVSAGKAELRYGQTKA